MDSSKVNNLKLLGTIQNADESGIIVYATQVYDSTGKQSVEERISEVANNASDGNSAAAAAQKAADNAQSTADSALSKANSNASEISSLKTSIAGINQFEYVVAGYLPTASADTMYKIYLVPTGVTTTEGTAEPTVEPGSSTANIKDEYITVKQGDLYYWEKLGTTEVDLSGYAKTSAIPTKVSTLTNDSGYQTAAQVKATKVDNAAKADTATSAGSATKATQDGDGNVISSTYAKATDVSATYLTAETVGTTTYDETSIDKVLNK